MPLYTRKLDEAGVHPDDIRSLDDVAKLPFTTKEDLRQTYPFGMFAVPMEQVAPHPRLVRHDRAAHRRRATRRATSTAGRRSSRDRSAASGIRPGMKVHNAYGYGLFTGGLGAHAGIEKLGATVIPMSGGQTARQVQLIRDFEPDAILCTPSYLLTIADAMDAAGIDPRSTSLKVAVLGAEPWTNEMRARARAAPRHRRASTSTGSARSWAPASATSASRRRTARTSGRTTSCPRSSTATTASALPDGEMGELVFTSLTKEAFPVLRYRTRDLTRLLPGTARPAHAAHREDHRPQRRHDHPARREPLPHADRGDRARHRDSSRRTSSSSSRATGTMDDLTVRIERHPDLRRRGVPGRAVVLAERIKEHIGSTVTVRLEEPGALPRSEGKYKRVYDLRNQ